MPIKLQFPVKQFPGNFSVQKYFLHPQISVATNQKLEGPSKKNIPGISSAVMEIFPLKSEIGRKKPFCLAERFDPEVEHKIKHWRSS